ACHAKVLMVLRGLPQDDAAKELGLKRHEVRKLQRWLREFKAEAEAAATKAVDEVAAAEQAAMTDDIRTHVLRRLGVHDERANEVRLRWRMRQALRAMRRHAP